MAEKPIETRSKNIDTVSEDSLFTADFFCEQRWPEIPDDQPSLPGKGDWVEVSAADGHIWRIRRKEGGHYHGRFAKVILRKERGQQRPCPVCGAASDNVPGAPTVTRVALPDGTKRKGITDQVICADLEVQAADLAWDSPERAQVETEIYERTKVRD